MTLAHANYIFNQVRKYFPKCIIILFSDRVYPIGPRMRNYKAANDNKAKL